MGLLAGGLADGVRPEGRYPVASDMPAVELDGCGDDRKTLPRISGGDSGCRKLRGVVVLWKSLSHRIAVDRLGLMTSVLLPIRCAITGCLVLAIGAAPVLATSASCAAGTCTASAEAAAPSCCCPSVDGTSCGMACCAADSSSEQPAPAVPQRRDQQERHLAWALDAGSGQPASSKTFESHTIATGISFSLPAGTLQTQHVRMQT